MNETTTPAESLLDEALALRAENLRIIAANRPRSLVRRLLLTMTIVAVLIAAALFVFNRTTDVYYHSRPKEPIYFSVNFEGLGRVNLRKARDESTKTSLMITIGNKQWRWRP